MRAQLNVMLARLWARLHWFERSGHMPMRDEPAETLRLVRETVGLD